MLAKDWILEDLNMAKIVAWAKDDIEEAASLGVCGLKLITISKVIRERMTSNTQEIEGVNSIIRLISERCRNVGLDLLDARVRVKKALGLGSVDQPRKWSHA